MTKKVTTTGIANYKQKKYCVLYLQKHSEV